MNISLTPHLEDMVKAKIGAGLYNSESELVGEALHLLEERDQIREMKLDALRREIQLGINSGDLVPMDEAFEQVHAAIRAVEAQEHREELLS